MSETKRGWLKNMSPEDQQIVMMERYERQLTQARESARRNKVRTAARKYGIPESELQSLIDIANGVCILCTGPLGDKLNVDHCHETGKVRNVLCQSCNNGLGQFKDNIETLERAISYLKSHQS